MSEPTNLGRSVSRPRLIDINALLADGAAMLALSEVTWAHAGTAMPCSAEGGREGLLAALEAHEQEETDV